MHNMRVKNRKIIWTMALRSLLISRKRSTITVIAIALTTLLFTSVFTIALSLNSSYQEYEDGGYSNDGGMTVMGGSGSRDAEFNRVKKAGGWDKYLELDKTANGRVMYKYFEAPGYEEFPSNMCLNGAKQATALICQVIRYMKGEREHYGEYSSKVYGEDKLKNAKEYIERSQVKKGKEDEPIAKADADALMAEWERVNAEYHAFLAKNEKPVSQEQVKAAYDNYAKGCE